MESTGAAVWERYPDITIDHDNAGLYEGWLERELRLPKCGDCGKFHHPARGICPFCWSTNLKLTPVSGRGVVYLAIVQRLGPPTPGISYPYPLVAVELEEQKGLRFTSTIVGTPGDEGVPLGTPVALEWIEREGAPVPVFRAVGAPQKEDRP